MEQYQWLTTLPSLIGIGLLGMLMHFFKQKIQGETITAITGYFRDNFKSTFVAVVSTVVAVTATYFTLGTGQPIDIMAVFGVGFTCDNIFNKWEKPA